MANPKQPTEKTETPDPLGMIEATEPPSDKRWFRSKKFAMWLISFLTLAGMLGWSLQASADRWVSISLVVTMGSVSGVGMLGQAFIDTAVRFAQAWKGSSVWAESKR